MPPSGAGSCGFPFCVVVSVLRTSSAYVARKEEEKPLPNPDRAEPGARSSGTQADSHRGGGGRTTSVCQRLGNFQVRVANMDAETDPKLDAIVVGHGAPPGENIFGMEAGAGRNMAEAGADDRNGGRWELFVSYHRLPCGPVAASGPEQHRCGSLASLGGFVSLGCRGHFCLVLEHKTFRRGVGRGQTCCGIQFIR